MYNECSKAKMLEVIQESNLASIKELVQVIDPESILKLVHAFGGNDLFIPRIDSLNLKLRDKNILDDYYKNGLSYSQLSKKYNLGVRRIGQIINGG